MEFIVKKVALGAAANKLSKVINPKSDMPIVTNILFDVHDNILTLTATDCETTATATVCLEEMKETGKLCVPAGALTDALAELADQPLMIKADDGYMEIHHESGMFHFPMEEADTFPIPPETKFSEPIELDGTVLYHSLKRAIWAVATDELRLNMAGVYAGIEGGMLDIVASDGRALVKQQIVVPDNKTCQSMIIPKKAATLLLNMLTESTTFIRMSDRECEVQCENYTLRSRLIEEKYPNYNSVIPTGQPLMAKVSRTWLINSVRKVQPFASSGHPLLRLAFTENQLIINGEDFALAKGATDSLKIEYTGHPIEVGLKPTLLLNILSKLPCEEVYIMMSAPNRAVTFQPVEQPETVDVLMLLMPMMINQD